MLEQGIDRLTVSAICKLAKVNQGMFVYNFKNKSMFMNKLLNNLLSDVLKELVLKDNIRKKPIERMEYGLVFCGVAASKYPQLFLQFNNNMLLSDDERKKTMTQLFIRRCNRELRRIFRFFPLAQESGDISKKITLAEFLALIWPALIYSCIAMEPIINALPGKYRQSPDDYLTHDAIRTRVRKLLRSFRPENYDPEC